MLFLAVFCGFLAEYTLEHKIEADREKQFMHTMLEDLKSDTVQLNQQINMRKSWQIRVDSLALLLNRADRDKWGNDIYFCFQYVSGGRRFLSNDRTLQQLKNAGNLRLVRKQKVSDAIIKYDQSIRRILYLSEIETQMKHDNRNKAYKIFLSGEVEKFRDMIRPLHNPPLLDPGPIVINEFCGDVMHIKNLDRGVLRAEENLLAQATQLMEVIRSEYRLK